MSLLYDPDAFGGVPTTEYRRMVDKCEWLWKNRRILRHTPLRHDLNPLLKWVVGHYRIIYTFDDGEDALVIRLIAHRRNVYDRAAHLGN